jgi:hypothetical protein
MNGDDDEKTCESVAPLPEGMDANHPRRRRGPMSDAAAMSASAAACGSGILAIASASDPAP